MGAWICTTATVINGCLDTYDYCLQLEKGAWKPNFHKRSAELKKVFGRFCQYI